MRVWGNQSFKLSDRDYLLSKIEIVGDCWLWSGPFDKDGYGKAVSTRAHRLSYEIFKGQIPDDTFVCHSCDVPACCNPEHLWLGSNSSNQLDSVIKNDITIHEKLTARTAMNM